MVTVYLPNIDGIIIEQDRCHSLPCQNGGTCIQEITGTYKCQCQEGFRGFNCEGKNHIINNKKKRQNQKIFCILDPPII